VKLVGQLRNDFVVGVLADCELDSRVGKVDLERASILVFQDVGCSDDDGVAVRGGAIRELPAIEPGAARKMDQCVEEAGLAGLIRTDYSHHGAVHVQGGWRSEPLVAGYLDLDQTHSATLTEHAATSLSLLAAPSSALYMISDFGFIATASILP